MAEKSICGVTGSGFAYDVPATRMANMELVDALAECETNPLAVSRVCLLLLGAEQRKRLYDFLRAEDGTVPAEKVDETLSEILGISKTGKN